VEKKNRNAEIIADLRLAMSRALTTEEEQALLEFLPEEVLGDGKEIHEILKAYQMSRHQKNKYRKEEEALAKTIHLTFGYKEPCVVLTAKHVFAPMSLKKKMEVTATQMEAVHPTHVNYLSNGIRMLQSVLSGVSDVKRSAKNVEADLSEKLEREYMKIQRKRMKAKKKGDEGEEDVEDVEEDKIDYDKDPDNEMDVVDNSGDNIQNSIVVEDSINLNPNFSAAISMSNDDESSESAVQRDPENEFLSPAKKMRVRHPVVRDNYWNAEMNLSSLTPKAFDDRAETLQLGIRKMPPPYAGYVPNSKTGTSGQDTISEGSMSAIDLQMSTTVVQGGKTATEGLVVNPKQDQRNNPSNIISLTEIPVSLQYSSALPPSVIPIQTGPSPSLLNIARNTPSNLIRHKKQTHQQVELRSVAFGSPLLSANNSTMDQKSLRVFTPKLGAKAMFENDDQEDGSEESTFRFSRTECDTVQIIAKKSKHEQPNLGLYTKGKSNPGLIKSNVNQFDMQKFNVDESHQQKFNVDEPQLLKSNEGESHLMKSNVGESQKLKSNVSESHQQKSNVDEPHLQKSNVGESQKLKSNVDESHLQKSNVDQLHLLKSNVDQTHQEMSGQLNTERSNMVQSKLELANTVVMESHKETTPEVGRSQEKQQEDSELATDFGCENSENTEMVYKNTSQRRHSARSKPSLEMFQNRVDKSGQNKGEDNTSLEALVSDEGSPTGEHLEEGNEESCQLWNFMKTRGVNTKNPPKMSGKEVDLVQFYKFTKENGGYVECHKNKLWKSIAEKLEIKLSTSGTHSLRKNYEKYILPFECHKDRGDADPTSVIEQAEQTTKRNRTKSQVKFKKPDKLEKSEN